MYNVGKDYSDSEDIYNEWQFISLCGPTLKLS